MAANDDTPERPIVTMGQAKAAGLSRYFSGRRCVHGHLAERTVARGQCVACVADYHAAKWRESEDFRQRSRERAADWVAKNPERCRQVRRDRYAANKAILTEKAAVWAAANRDKVRAIKAAWKKRNPENGAAWTSKRRTDQLKATPAWSDLAAIEEIYAECARTTRKTGIQHHVDHIVPVKGRNVCGLHVHYNLQILPARQNISKNNKMPEMIDGVVAPPRQYNLFIKAAA